MPLNTGILRFHDSKTTCFGVVKILQNSAKDASFESKTTCFAVILGVIGETTA